MTISELCNIIKPQQILHSYVTDKCYIILYRNYIILHFDVIVNMHNADMLKFFVKVVLIIDELRRSLTDYGLKIKMKLLQYGKTQTWLIKKIKEQLPYKYVDNSNLYKIMTGQIKSRDIESAINRILDIEMEDK